MLCQKKLIWKSYIVTKTLSRTRQIKIIKKKEFILAVLDSKNKTFILYIISIITLVYSNWKALITGLEVETIIVFIKYSNFINVIFTNSTTKLPKYFKISYYFMNLKKDKQPLYRPIYGFELVKLEILNIYIKINFANSFIKFLKSSISTLILFIC